MSPSLLVLMARLTLVESSQRHHPALGASSWQAQHLTCPSDTEYGGTGGSWRKTRPPMRPVSRLSRVLSMLGSRISQQ